MFLIVSYIFVGFSKQQIVNFSPAKSCDSIKDHYSLFEYDSQKTKLSLQNYELLFVLGFCPLSLKKGHFHDFIFFFDDFFSSLTGSYTFQVLPKPCLLPTIFIKITAKEL